ncbi:MAG: radical SAM protein [Candidatus Omnitrophota bacterium]|nr:radical SAM protein [Candidatus Omnitrophota bacterium]
MIELVLGYKDFIFKKPKALLRVFSGIFDRAILKRPHLRVAEIAITFTCNSKCVMCSCFKLCNPEKEKTRMSPDEYASLGRQLDELGCVSVNITGGEPLMRHDVSEIIPALNPDNKIVNLVTNGINLTQEKIREYTLLGIDTIVVSLESVSEEENDKIRGYNGHFKAVMNALEWSKKEKVNFAISLTLGDFNFNKIYEMLRFAENNAIFLCIAHGGSIGRWSGNYNVYLSEPNAFKVLELVKKYKIIKTDFSANLSLLPGCPAILEKIYITPYGEVWPCAFNPISFGNLRQESLRDIWGRMINFYRQNIGSKSLCLRTYDRQFIERFNEPIRSLGQSVPVEKHPAFLKET